MHTVRKVYADFAVCDVLRYCKAVCDVKFSQVEENGRQITHKEIYFPTVQLKITRYADPVLF